VPGLKKFVVSVRNMPVTASWGVIVWTAAWINFLIHIYRLTQDSGWVGKSAVAVGLLIIFLLRGQNWARVIALMAGAMAILFLSFLAYLVRGTGETALAVFGAAIFGLAVYLLALRSTADYFKTMSKAENSSKPMDPS
jgi:hypothetical protein